MEQLGFLQRNCTHRPTLPPHSPFKSSCFWGGKQEMLNREGQAHARLGNRKQRCSRAGCGHSAKGEAAEVTLCSAPWPGTCMVLLINTSQPLLPPMTSAATTKGSAQGFGKVEGSAWSPWLEIQPSTHAYLCSLRSATSMAASRRAASNLYFHLGALKAVSKLTQLTHIVKSSDTAV